MSRADYLKKYESRDDGDDKAKKKKLIRKSVSSNLRIVDHDFDWRQHSHSIGDDRAENGTLVLPVHFS